MWKLVSGNDYLEETLKNETLDVNSVKSEKFH